MLKLQARREVVEILTVFKDSFLFKLISDKSIDLSCDFNLLLKFIKHLTLNREEDRLDLDDHSLQFI